MQQHNNVSFAGNQVNPSEEYEIDWLFPTETQRLGIVGPNVYISWLSVKLSNSAFTSLVLIDVWFV
jgi:hypothetical protein